MCASSGEVRAWGGFGDQAGCSPDLGPGGLGQTVGAGRAAGSAAELKGVLGLRSLHSYCLLVAGGDRSAGVTGGLPSVWELPPQLPWQLGPNPTLFTSCEEIQNGLGALHIHGLLTHPPP